MTQVEQLLPLRCPDHSSQMIGMLSVNPDARKIGYCYDCIEEDNKDGSVIQTLKSVSSYLTDKSDFYKKCLEKVSNIGEPPAEYVDVLSKKGECLEKFSQHIDQERNKVKRSFEGIRKIVEQVINDKEKECLELLNKEILDLSEAYLKFEKYFKMVWPKTSESQNVYPGINILKERMSQIKNPDQLKAFMTEIQEDARIQDLYFVEESGLLKIRKKMDDLVRDLNIPEYCFPKIHSAILDEHDLKNIIKDLMKGFISQGVEVNYSIFTRMTVLTSEAYESKIIGTEQFRTLRNWLLKGYRFNLKLLYRSSTDGMSSEKFHEKCDGRGATITLAKCRFDGAPGPHTLGGFLDQSWNSKNGYESSKGAFLFSLGEQQATSVKCPILETQSLFAFRAGPQYGPTFGRGSDFHINGSLSAGCIDPESYSNSIALRHGYGRLFKVEEVEVFQVQ